MYAHSYISDHHSQECQFALTCTQIWGTHASRELTREDTERWRTGKGNATGPPQHTCFAESSTERSRRLAALSEKEKLGRAQERLRLNRTRKVSLIYTWLVKTLHNVLFLLHFLLFSSCPLSFYCTLTSLLWHLAYPHAQCAYAHCHGAARGIMRMRSPSISTYSTQGCGCADAVCGNLKKSSLSIGRWNWHRDRLIDVQVY